jgi:hypothetical protein
LAAQPVKAGSAGRMTFFAFTWCFFPYENWEEPSNQPTTTRRP